MNKKVNKVATTVAPKEDKFTKVTSMMHDIYVRKNHDYGNSFDNSLDKHGIIAAIVRMEDKLNRLNSLKDKDAKVEESINDTLLDLANYAIMTYMYYKK